MNTFNLAVSGLAIAVSLSGISSCSAGAADSEVPSLRLVMSAADSCAGVAHGNEDFGLPASVAEVVVRIANEEATVIRRFSLEEASPGRVMLSKITPGDYTVDVVLCDGAQQASWAGSAGGVTVEAHEKTFPDIFLTPIGNTACTDAASNTLAAGAFASTAVDGERVYVLGGLSDYDPQQVVASGGLQTREYSMLDGSMSPLSGSLDEQRFGARADMTSDGKVRLIGGARDLSANNPDPVGQPDRPLIWPIGGAPTCSVLDFDPNTGDSVCVSGATRFPAWPSVAKVGSSFVAVGGVASDARSDAAYVLTGDTIVTATMGSPRFGATVVGMGSSAAFIFGGSASDPASMAETLLVDGTVVPLTFASATPAPAAIPYLAAGFYLGDAAGRDAVVIAGGHDLTPPSSAGVQSEERLMLLLIDRSADEVEWVALDVGEDIRHFERTAASIVELDDGDLLLVGGFTAFREHDQGSDQCDDPSTRADAQIGQCLPRSMVRFRVNAANGTATVVETVELTLGPLGAVATPLGDGALLLTSGLRYITGGPQRSQDTGIPSDSELIRFSGALDTLCDSQETP